MIGLMSRSKQKVGSMFCFVLCAYIFFVLFEYSLSYFFSFLSMSVLISEVISLILQRKGREQA